jgi:hypothetical protein
MIEPLHKIGTTLECKSEICQYIKDCAHHETAGDFRFEDGFTPQIAFNERNQHYFCKGNIHTHLSGAYVFTAKKLLVHSSIAGNF